MTRLPKNGMPPIHPGEFVAELLGELGVSHAAFARAIGVSPSCVSRIVHGTRPVTADLALRFGRAFGHDARSWVNLQNAYDLKVAERDLGESLRKVRRLAA